MHFSIGVTFICNWLSYEIHTYWKVNSYRRYQVYNLILQTRVSFTIYSPVTLRSIVRNQISTKLNNIENPKFLRRILYNFSRFSVFNALQLRFLCDLPIVFILESLISLVCRKHWSGVKIKTIFYKPVIFMIWFDFF